MKIQFYTTKSWYDRRARHVDFEDGQNVWFCSSIYREEEGKVQNFNAIEKVRILSRRKSIKLSSVSRSLQDPKKQDRPLRSFSNIYCKHNLNITILLMVYFYFLFLPTLGFWLCFSNWKKKIYPSRFPEAEKRNVRLHLELPLSNDVSTHLFCWQSEAKLECERSCRSPCSLEANECDYSCW